MKKLILVALMAVGTLSSCKKIECPPAGDVCQDIYDPVCGSDGKTYGNECYAKRAGVKSWTKGECNR